MYLCPFFIDDHSRLNQYHNIFPSGSKTLTPFPLTTIIDRSSKLSITAQQRTLIKLCNAQKTIHNINITNEAVKMYMIHPEIILID
jgi:hypothetical protein